MCEKKVDKRKRRGKPYKPEKPATIAQASALSIAEMQKVDDGARPYPDKKLLEKIKDFDIDNESTVEIDIKRKDLYLSVDQDLEEVEAKIDQHGNLIIQVKEKNRCCGFEGVSHVELRASTGITRAECDFEDIICQNGYDVEKFTVTFTQNDCDGVCHKDTSLERSTHLSFERGRLYIREGRKKYLTERL